jgi:hypothetical protein
VVSVLRVVGCGAVLVTCSRQPPPAAAIPLDASGSYEMKVRVPAALSLARALDTLSVSLDPSSLADTAVTVDAGMIVGVESDVVVFPLGSPQPDWQRHGFQSGADFTLGVDTWSTSPDGIPAPGTRYVAEMRLVLFETDVPPQHEWNPHGGRFNALWTRTLRQAEE